MNASFSKHVKRGKVQAGMHFTPVRDSKAVATHKVGKFLFPSKEEPKYELYGTLYGYSTLDAETRAHQMAQAYLRSSGMHVHVVQQESAAGTEFVLVDSFGECIIAVVSYKGALTPPAKFMPDTGKHEVPQSALSNVL